MSSSFPTVAWGKNRVTFLPEGAAPPPEAPVTAALVFAFEGERFVVAEIAGRGWCIPGGRIEAGETPEQAAHREAREEIGGTLANLRRIGTYLFQATTGAIEGVPTFVATVTARGPLPAGTKSQGVRLLAFEELPAYYFLWDPLIEAVFTYAYSRYTGKPPRKPEARQQEG